MAGSCCFCQVDIPRVARLVRPCLPDLELGSLPLPEAHDLDFEPTWRAPRSQDFWTTCSACLRALKVDTDTALNRIDRFACRGSAICGGATRALS